MLVTACQVPDYVLSSYMSGSRHAVTRIICPADRFPTCRHLLVLYVGDVVKCHLLGILVLKISL